MRWVYLSPHFDDIVLSCGGMVWEQVQAAQPVEIWTICAGAPEDQAPLSIFAQELHRRWGVGVEAVAERRAEDAAAVQRLGAAARYWTLPDAIYRRLPDQTWLVDGEDGLWQPVHSQEQGVVEKLCAWLAQGLSAADSLVIPLTFGNHVDHNLTRAAAERAAEQVGCAAWYYPDYPYVVKPGADWAQKTGEGWSPVCQTISPAGLHAWQDGVACYRSQMSTFFKDRDDLDAALEDYLKTGGGACLWRPA